MLKCTPECSRGFQRRRKKLLSRAAWTQTGKAWTGHCQVGHLLGTALSTGNVKAPRHTPGDLQCSETRTGPSPFHKSQHTWRFPLTMLPPKNSTEDFSFLTKKTQTTSGKLWFLEDFFFFLTHRQWPADFTFPPENVYEWIKYYLLQGITLNLFLAFLENTCLKTNTTNSRGSYFKQRIMVILPKGHWPLLTLLLWASTGNNICPAQMHCPLKLHAWRKETPVQVSPLQVKKSPLSQKRQ